MPAMTLVCINSVQRGLQLPDLGFRNRRFQSVPFRFKKQVTYEGKNRFFAKTAIFTIDE